MTTIKSRRNHKGKSYGPVILKLYPSQLTLLVSPFISIIKYMPPIIYLIVENMFSIGQSLIIDPNIITKIAKKEKGTAFHKIYGRS